MKKIPFIALGILVVASCFFALCPLAAQAAPAEDLYLHIGSPLALSGGRILPLDKADPDISPRLHHSHTLVPLRFVGEYFGAEVSYDAAAKTAVIAVNEQTARFTVGVSSYTLNGVTYTLGTETLLVDGKAMVPLRAICEAVLGLPIEYRAGVIRIGTAGELTEEQAREVKSKIGQYLQVNSLDELNQYLMDENKLFNNDLAYALSLEEEAPVKAAPAMAPAAPTATPAQDAAAADYSQTNVQTSGVDEGDIIKTDGKYIYICAGRRVNLVLAAGGSLKLAGQIELPENYSIADMYVDGPYVVLTGSYYYSDGDRSAPQSLPYYTDFTFARVYDMSDPGQARLHREYGIQGQAITTRKQGDYLYLLTSNYVSYSGGNDPRPYVLENGTLAPMPLNRILVIPQIIDWRLTTLSALNIRDAAEKPTSKTVPGSAEGTYMSNNAFYVTCRSIFTKDHDISVTRFSLDGAKIAYTGSGAIKGSVNDQFSMDEYEGCLRLATTDSRGGNTNHLFVLDENMEICGQVNDYAPGERIYSARFMGQRGYVVTFRQMDPLFVFDLSDPRDPKITGELKVPGFSNYLHPVAENVLLGVGQDSGDVIFRDSSGQETVVGQRTGGLKLSLFDISDMGKPQELSTLVLGSQGHSELLDNHKAAMFKADDSLLAFPAQIYEGTDSDSEYFSGALLISYAGNKLSERGRINDENTYEDGFVDKAYYYGSSRRVVYIGNTLYYLQNGLLRAFDLGTLKETGRLRL